tara:strand:+ start:1246 stop:1419 length:174 start_codon:yes stop_codon:yes gene_type:complete
MYSTSVAYITAKLIVENICNKKMHGIPRGILNQLYSLEMGLVFMNIILNVSFTDGII